MKAILLIIAFVGGSIAYPVVAGILDGLSGKYTENEVEVADRD